MEQIEDKSEGIIKRRMILSVVFLLAGIVYLISPIDLIPDILGPIGWVDDIFFLIVSFLLSFLSWLKMKKEKRELEDRRGEV